MIVKAFKVTKAFASVVVAVSCTVLVFMNDSEIAAVLKQRYVLDLKKPDFDKFERANIIRSIMDDKGISIREFARINGLHRSTVEDWLVYDRISEEQYRSMVDKGLTRASIYRELRKDKKTVKEISALDTFLEEIKHKLRLYRKENLVPSRKTGDLINQLVNDLNNLHVEIELREKRKSKT